MPEKPKRDYVQMYKRSVEFFNELDIVLKRYAERKYPNTEYGRQLANTFYNNIKKELVDTSVVEYGRTVPTSDVNLRNIRLDMYKSKYQNFNSGKNEKISADDASASRIAQAFKQMYESAEKMLDYHKIALNILPSISGVIKHLYKPDRRIQKKDKYGQLEFMLEEEIEEKEDLRIKKEITSIIKEVKPIQVRCLLEDMLVKELPFYEKYYKD